MGIDLLNHKTKQTKPENPFLNLLFNVIIPIVLLSKYSKAEYLGPVGGLLAAMAFPIFYGAYDFITRKTYNFLSILGLSSVVLTGGFGLLELEGKWFALKEATVPIIFAIAFLGSMRTKTPLVFSMLWNDQFLNIEKVKSIILALKAEDKLDSLIEKCTYLFAASFLVSAILNYTLAVVVLKSQPGTPEFNAELGQMQLLSWFVIVIPCLLITFYTFYYYLNGLKKITQLSMDEILVKK